MKKVLIFILLYCFCLAADKFDCSKKYCKQMSSCEEAYHYLKKCGRSNFDKDKDGVPCENVCGKK